MNKFWNWLVKSSTDPNEVALTVKGLLTGIIPLIIMLTGLANIHIGSDQLNVIIDSVVSAIQVILGIVASLLTLWGLVRKVIVTLS